MWSYGETVSGGTFDCVGRLGALAIGALAWQGISCERRVR